MGTRRPRPTLSKSSRVVLYVRVSAKMGRGGEEFHSPESQLASMRRATTGMNEVAVIDDIDVSGTTFSREGLDKIRAMVEARQVDAIAVYDWTRFGRNVKEALEFLDWLDKHGVAVIAGGEQTDRTTPEGEFTVGMLLHVAQMQSRIIGRHWSNTIAHRAQQGKAHGPVPPFGYRRGEAGPEPDPNTAPIVITAFQMYATGSTVADIIRYIGVARGKPINRAATKRMLYNVFYVGKVRIHDEVFDGLHTPIVDADTWEQVRKRLRRDSVTPPRRLNPAYSLTGLVMCAHCDRPLLADRDPRGRRRLICQSRQREFGPCPGPGMPLVDQVEDAVLVQLTDYIDDVEANIGAARDRAARKARAGADEDATKRKLDAVRAGMIRVHESWRSRITPDWLYKQDMAKMRAEEERLTVELEQLQTVQMSMPTDRQVDLAKQAVALWPDLLPPERHRLLKFAVRKVTVRRADYYREPVHKRVEVDFW